MRLQDALQEFIKRLNEHHPDLSPEEVFTMQIEDPIFMLVAKPTDQVITTMLINPDKMTKVVDRLEFLTSQLREYIGEEKNSPPAMSLN